MCHFMGLLRPAGLLQLPQAKAQMRDMSICACTCLVVPATRRLTSHAAMDDRKGCPPLVACWAALVPAWVASCT